MKKYLALVLAVLMALACVALVACGECKHFYYNGTCMECGQPDPNYNPGGNQGGTTSVDTTISDTALQCKNTGKIFVTSIGQNGSSTVTGLLDNLGITYTENAVLAASDVTANDIVIVVLGSSGKGLGGATGHSKESEIARFNAIAAVEGVEIIAVVPAGDTALRGATSDPIHQAACPKADVTLVINTANGDKFFNNLCAPGTLFEYSRASKMPASLQFLLNK